MAAKVVRVAGPNLAGTVSAANAAIAAQKPLHYALCAITPVDAKSMLLSFDYIPDIDPPIYPMEYDTLLVAVQHSQAEAAVAAANDSISLQAVAGFKMLHT